MKFKMKEVAYKDIRKYLIMSLEEQGSLMDSFLESCILESKFYKIECQGETAGTFAVKDMHLLSHFYVCEKFRKYGQDLFEMARKGEQVTHAYICSSDEIFLSHALDRPKSVETQAYFFTLSDHTYDPEKVLDGFQLQAATYNDKDLIIKGSGDFFDDVDKSLQAGELYLGYLNDEVVSFGIIEKSKLYSKVASTGMFVKEGHREKGLGSSTIIKLIQTLHKDNYTPIAGCWYYNHNSKKTLESAGYYTKTRLIKVNL